MEVFGLHFRRVFLDDVPWRSVVYAFMISEFVHVAQVLRHGGEQCLSEDSK